MIKSKLYNFFLIGIIFICLALVVVQNFNFITGFTVEYSATSDVSVLKSLSISFSDNLSEGILFGDIAILPVEDVNASHNYDGVDNSTSLYINISQDGNTPVDLCVKASGNLVSLAADEIGLGNETYSNSTSSNSTDPLLSQDFSLTTSYIKSGGEIPTGGINYYRFWLDIQASQPSGEYNNTISFKAIQTGSSC